MTTTTPNLALTLYNSTTDSAEYFSNFRATIAGTSLTSNFYKIDTAYGSMQSEIDAIQAGAYFTLANFISANYYEATVAGITSYTTGMKIILSLDTASAGTVTLNINSLGIKSVMKIDSSGTPTNIASGELMVGKYYFFAYDGTRWVWVDATSSDQIYTSGTSGNFLRVSSENVIEDSGSSPSTFAVVAKGVTNGDSHDHVGGDGASIVEGALSFTDITTNNSTSLKHGLLPKLSGSSSDVFKGDGTWGTSSPSISLTNVLVYTTSATWTKASYAGIYAVKVRLVGGGGGGGGIASATSAGGAGGGGGGGEYGEKFILATSLGTTETVTVGAGGAASATGLNNGGTGDTSSFGSHITAVGGGGGNGFTAVSTFPSFCGTPGTGGTGGTGGDFYVSGSHGIQALTLAVSATNSPSGGSSALAGITYLATALASDTNGTTGVVYGSGGTGARSSNTATAYAGGAGGAGIVIVEIYSTT